MTRNQRIYFNPELFTMYLRRNQSTYFVFNQSHLLFISKLLCFLE